MGFAISPSQATEAMFCSKGDIDKFKKQFTEDEIQRLVKWFYDNKPILRLANKNYMKIKRQIYNHSVNMRPSINMIRPPSIENHSISGTNSPKVLSPFSQNRTIARFADQNTEELIMRGKIQKTIKNIERMPKIKKQVVQSIQEWGTQKEK